MLKLRTFALLAFGLASLPAADAASFRAEYEHSRWESRQEGGICSLSHPIPRFGLALLTQDPSGLLALTVYAERPPTEEGRATVHSRSPEWKPAHDRQLDAARVRADGRMLQFSHFDAQRILAELEQGQEAVIRFEGWWAPGTTELALSPVNFRPALQAHFACLAGLPQPPATRAAPSSAALRLYHPTAPRAGSAASPRGTTAVPDAVELAVYFSTDDAGLDLLAMDTLRRFAVRLRDAPGSTAVVTSGHADPRGNKLYNRRLAERRARTVREYLHELGIEPERVDIVSHGAETLASTGSDGYALAENRRVTLTIVSGDASR